MEYIMAIFIGIGLSAAVGFRVFTPLLITSIAAKADFVTLVDSFSWIETTPALVAFAVATLFEIVSSYIPLVDQVMKMIATPAAITAGILLTAAFIGEMDPFLKWSIAIIAGGGTASISQLTTTAVRTASTAGTAGIVNPFISLLEGIMALFMSLLSLILPVLAVIGVIILFTILFFLLRWLRKRLPRKNVSLS